MRRSGLALRITVALLAVAGCTITLVAGIVFSTMQVGATVGPALLASPATGAKAGAILGGVLAVGIVLGTVHAGTSVVRNRFDARPIAETGYANDGIEPLVERLALRFDVPAPTIRVAETTVPHASVSGLTRRGATLVISEGLLDRSNRDQLTAVLAHELAHLANRDALVVTLVAVPAVFGRSVMDGLNSTNESEGFPARSLPTCSVSLPSCSLAVSGSSGNQCWQSSRVSGNSPPTERRRNLSGHQRRSQRHSLYSIPNQPRHLRPTFGGHRLSPSSLSSNRPNRLRRDSPSGRMVADR